LRRLTAKGIIVDRIDTVIGPFDFKKFPRLFGDDWYASEWASSFQELEQYGSSLSRSERDIFWRTLVLDSGKPGHGGLTFPAPREIGECFEVRLDGFAESDAVRAELTKLFYSQTGFVDRCFYATASGGKGIGSYGTLPGDLVAILYGGQFCYILREVSEHYVLVGDAYLHGATHGELLDQRRQEERKEYKKKISFSGSQNPTPKCSHSLQAAHQSSRPTGPEKEKSNSSKAQTHHPKTPSHKRTSEFPQISFPSRSSEIAARNSFLQTVSFNLPSTTV
jgi:hypothetical protein